ncbi:SDR family oxidoreductase [Ectopseudomonas mendocina]|uniref:SDR family oxidoreductase n=1 Tax=Ectopseudomonas mendocina TaxID=300 RepID=UPI0007FB45CF|nr:SDR family oxidoreductase [Pseudomonas mendocina]
MALQCAVPLAGVYAGQNDVFVSKLTQLIPIGAHAEADEYRGAIAFLCSDASAYMNGANLVIDGGRQHMVSRELIARHCICCGGEQLQRSSRADALRCHRVA